MIYLPLEEAKKCIKFMRKHRQGRQLPFGQEGVPWRESKALRVVVRGQSAQLEMGFSCIRYLELRCQR